MLEFDEVVKYAYEYCYNRSYPELPLDTDILEELPNWIGWEDIRPDLDNSNIFDPNCPYNKWLTALRSELNRQGLNYKRDE